MSPLNTMRHHFLPTDSGSGSKKSASESPADDFLTVPTNREDQAADVDRKLKLYGVIQAFRQGKMPDNDQVEEMLVYVKDHSFRDDKKLSLAGRKLMGDFRDLAETTRVHLREKNGDEVVQRFFYHTSHAHYKGGANSNVETRTPVTEKEAHKDGIEAMQHLRDLFKILLTNSEARKLISDVKLIGRDLFAETAATLAHKARPDDEMMAQVDDPAFTDAFDAFPDMNPDPAVEPEPVNVQVDVPFLEPFADEELGGESVPNSPTSPTSPNSPASPTTPSGLPMPAATPGHKLQHSSESGSPTTSSSSEHDKGLQVRPPSTKKSSFKARIQSLTGRAQEKHRKRVTDELESVTKNIKEEFPRERRDIFVYRLKKLVVDCQSQPSYKSTLTWLITQMETYFGHGKSFVNMGSNQTYSFFSDPYLTQGISELRTIFERGANGKSVEPMIRAMQKLWESSQGDKEMREWWGRVNVFVKKTFLQTGFILSSQFEIQAHQLRKESQKFFDAKYAEHKNALLNAIEEWFGAWGEDPLNKRLTEDWSRIVKDLLFDGEGKLVFKAELWSDIRQVILPRFASKVGYIPIPRIEYTDKSLDLVIENLTLQGRNIFPNILELYIQNYIKLSPQPDIKDEHHHTLVVNLSQIQADMRDVAFYYHKKTGLPRISDSGLADVFLGGKGITVTIKINSREKDREHGLSLFKVKDVAVDLGNLKFTVRDSRHKLLYKTLRPLATRLIKKQIANAIADGVRAALEYVDTQLVVVRDRIKEAESRTEAIKELVTHSRAPSEIDSKSSKSNSKRSSKFKIVARRNSMLLPEQVNERGWIRKQVEKNREASEGSGWKSKAFSVIP